MSASADPHDVWKSHLPLGVSCNHCLHRALIEHARIGARASNGTCLDELPLICSKCGHRDFAPHVFRARREVKRFMVEYR